jgi:hypothetical protein
MDSLKQALADRRLLLAMAGAAIALVAGLGAAMVMSAGHRGETSGPSPAAQAGLIVETGAADDGKLSPTARLRCFVAGQFVGEATLAECAQKNGVATGALDVGVDESGNLAAAEEAGAMLVPLPPAEAQPAPPATPAASTPLAAPPVSQPVPTRSASTPAPSGTCWRYAGAEWRKLPADMTLGACVQTLFAGKCEHAGGATYGRWMSQTLRLVPGKVEVSGDNRAFRTLVEQSGNCALAPLE